MNARPEPQLDPPFVERPRLRPRPVTLRSGNVLATLERHAPPAPFVKLWLLVALLAALVALALM
jgi:hypothetical protein